MTRAPALNTHASVRGVDRISILKVLTREEAEQGLYDPGSVLLWDSDACDAFAGSLSSTQTTYAGRIQVSAQREPLAIQPGDIIRLRANSTLATILYRRGSRANTLFATERCNSLCLMCSQPPRDDHDSWRVGELYQTIALIDRNEAQIGISGGEPTLLGNQLAGLINACRETLPLTHVHVLTNGRLFSDVGLADSFIEAGGDSTVWAVPVYADVAGLHDEIVDAPGAFAETMDGLFHLARRGTRVEIRVVLHAMTIPRLTQLATYLYRRLPFAEHIAFMGLEPMGLARANRERLWIDPADYQKELAAAVHYLATRGMAVSVYNLPFCILPQDLWPFARQSISDWKNVEDEACTRCEMTSSCAGFFKSAGPEWRSRSIAPISMTESLHELA